MRREWKRFTTWISVIHVCRRWREVALSHSIMWTGIFCPSRRDITEFFLTHSNDLPLSAIYSSKDSDDASVSQLLSQMHRICRLHVFEAEDGDVARISTELRESQREHSLQFLMFTPSMIAAHDSMPVLDDRLLAVLPESTTSILFAGKIGGPFRCDNLPKITYLSYTIFGLCQLNHVFDILRKLPNLEVLSLGIAGPPTPFEPSCQIVELNRLRLFRWKGIPALGQEVFRVLKVPIDACVDVSYPLEDEQVEHALSFIEPYQRPDQLTFPRASIKLDDSGSPGSTTCRGRISFSLHQSADISPQLRYTEFGLQVDAKREQASIYVQCHYMLSQGALDSFIGELKEPQKNITHLTLAFQLEDRQSPLQSPLCDMIRSFFRLTHLTLTSSVAVQVIAAALDPRSTCTNTIPLPSLRRILVFDVQPDRRSNTEGEARHFTTLLEALELRAARGILLDVLKFVACGVEPATVRRFRESGFIRQGVSWDQGSDL